MATKQITIQKMDVEAPKVQACAGGAKRKTVRTFPRGILRKPSKFTLKGVADPAKSPQLKKGMKKHTLRMLTEKGAKKRHRTLRRRVSKMSPKQLDEVLGGKGLASNPNTPHNIKQAILANAAEAGFVSV